MMSEVQKMRVVTNKEKKENKTSVQPERRRNRLVDLLDAGTLLTTGGRSTAREAAWCATGEATWCAASATVELLHDGVGDRLELLLLRLVLVLRRLLRVVEP